MTFPDQSFREMGNHSLGAAVEFWWDALIQWCNLGDSHGDIVLSGPRNQAALTHLI